MNILCIDTSNSEIALALSKNGQDYYRTGGGDCKRHNSVLISEIDSLLGEADVKLNEIDVFGVVVGPGSFTGIRIGVATANAFSLALGKKTVEIISLDMLLDGKDKVALLDCKHGNFYAAVAKDGKTEYMPLSEDEIASIDAEKVYLTSVLPEKMLAVCKEKVKAGLFVSQAKPFYMKRSSAERETGILC